MFHFALNILLEHVSSEKLATKAIAEGRAIETVKKTSATNKTGVPSNIHKIMEAEEYKGIPASYKPETQRFIAETVSFDFKIALQKARMEKKMTQADLAKVSVE